MLKRFPTLQNDRPFSTVVACLVTLMIVGVSQVARADEMLDRFLTQAMATNPEILAARQRWEAIKEQAPQARALDDPVVSIIEWSIPSNFNLGETGETWYGIEQVPIMWSHGAGADVMKRIAAP